MHERRSRPRRRLSAGTRNISLALGLCLCAGQLVAAPAAGAAPAAAPTVVTGTALSAPAAGTPKVGIAATKRTIGWGSATTLTANVTDPRTRKAVSGGHVRLQGWQKGAWRTWQMKRLPAAGKVAFTTAPRSTHVVRLLFTGTATYKATPSAKITIRVTASGAKVIDLAKRLKGSPYRYGAAGPRAFDCSGFTKYVFKKAAGKKLPHKANSQQRHGRAVSKAKARPGDLIIVRRGSYGYHAGIYAGNGYIYDSPHAGAKVGRHKLWTRSYVVRRLVG